MNEETNQSTDPIIVFYEQLGFSEIEIEDKQTALCVEREPDGIYGLLTDEAGNKPQNLLTGVIFACYSEQDSFMWSTSVKSSTLFQTLWSEPQDLAGKFKAIEQYRKQENCD